MYKVQYRMRCTCGEWTSDEYTAVFSLTSTIHPYKDALQQAEKEHSQATVLAPRKGHYLRTVWLSDPQWIDQQSEA